MSTLGFFDGDAPVAATVSNSTLIAVLIVLAIIAVAIWIVRAIR
jgi:flagellar biogenesis protein FliO